jgi:hypothetical protein
MIPRLCRPCRGSRHWGGTKVFKNLLISWGICENGDIRASSRLTLGVSTAHEDGTDETALHAEHAAS